jgi:hypothetical protein
MRVELEALARDGRWTDLHEWADRLAADPRHHAALVEGGAPGAGKRSTSTTSATSRGRRQGARLVELTVAVQRCFQGDAHADGVPCSANVPRFAPPLFRCAGHTIDVSGSEHWLIGR